MKVIVNPHKCIIEKTPVNELEVNVTKVEFEFDSEIPANLVKEAYFTLEDNTYKVIIENNECNIPNEVLVKKGTVTLGVVAFEVVNNQTLTRYNPSPTYFNTWDGSLKEADNTEPITPSEMEQFEQQLQEGLDNIDEAIEKAENLDINAVKSDNKTIITITKQDETQQVVEILDGAKGDKGDKGNKGDKGDKGEQGIQGVQGIQGQKGDTGAPFTIKKTYSSVAEMNADFDNMELGDYVMIASSVEVQDNAKLYTKGQTQWIFITDFSGATGIQGEKGEQGEQGVQGLQGIQGEKGDKGDTGDTGNGISSITKISSVDTTDTYRITFTDGTTYDYEITNGEVSQAQLDELQAQVDRYKLLENALPHITGTGTELTLNNTVNAGMTIDLEPNTSQESTPSPDYPQTIHTISGDNEVKVENKNLSITSTYVRGLIDGSGKYSTNGTTDININNNTITVTTTVGYRGAVSDWIEVKSNTAYILSYNGDTPNANYYLYLNWYDKDKAFIQRDGGDAYRTSPANAKYVRIFIMSNLIGTFSISNIQLEQNSTATSYEPHEEQVVNIPLGVKNLFDENNVTFTTGILDDNGQPTGSTSSHYTNEFYSVKPNKDYTLSGTISTGNTTYRIYFYDINKNWLSRTDSLNQSIRTFTTVNNCYYIRIQVGASVTLKTGDVQLEEGTVAHSYSPYGQEPIEYCKIPNSDYKDQFYLASDTDTSLVSGKWYLKKNIPKIDSYNGETITTPYISTTGGLDTGATIYYVAQSPTYIPLNNTLQEALNTLQEKLLAYKGQTNISQVNNDLPFEIVASALKDISNL